MKFDSGKLASFLEKHRNCQGTFKLTSSKDGKIKVRCMGCNDVDNITPKEPLVYE